MVTTDKTGLSTREASPAGPTLKLVNDRRSAQLPALTIPGGSSAALTAEESRDHGLPY
jgi:hypothetical protein